MKPETGTGNSKDINITVTATREVEMTCISAYSDAVLTTSSEPISFRFPDDEDPEASATFVTDDNGQLTGMVQIHTSLSGYETGGGPDDPWEPGDVCARYRDGSGVYILKDYSLTYTDLTVTDHENGGASETIARVEDVPGKPGYSWEGVTAGISFFGQPWYCTLGDDGSGSCETS